MTGRKYDEPDDEDRGPLSEHDADSLLEYVADGETLEPGLGIRDESGQDATPLVASRAGTLNIDTGAVSSGQDQRSRKLSNSSKVVAWRDLPKKRQLLVITLARLSEPLVQTSLQVA